MVVARLQQPPRAQQASDVVRPERWCGPAHGTSSDGWKRHEPILKAGVAVTTTADGPELVAEIGGAGCCSMLDPRQWP